MSEATNNERASKRGLGRKLFWALAILAVLFILSSVRDGWGLARRGGFGLGRGRAPFSAEQIAARLTKRTDRFLNHIDATSEQRLRIHAVVDRLEPELASLQGERNALAAKFKNVFGAEQLNREELAQAQIAGLQMIDRASDKLLDALAETWDVLTPQQRQQLLNDWNRWQ